MSNKSVLPYYNKKLVRNYKLFKTYQAGLSLLGFEVKALINGAFDLSNAYVIISSKDEMFLLNLLLTIPKDNINKPQKNHKLLLNKHEIIQIKLKKNQLKATIIPVKLFILNHKIKLEISLAKSKTKPQKKQALIAKDLAKKYHKLGTIYKK